VSTPRNLAKVGDPGSVGMALTRLTITETFSSARDPMTNL